MFALPRMGGSGRAARVRGLRDSTSTEGVPESNASDAMPPQSLRDKTQRLQALADQRQQEGVDVQPVAELLQGFDPLMQQKKYAEAEALVDKALKLLADSAPAK